MHLIFKLHLFIAYVYIVRVDVKDNLWESVLFFHHGILRDWTQIVRLGWTISWEKGNTQLQPFLIHPVPSNVAKQNKTKLSTSNIKSGGLGSLKDGHLITVLQNTPTSHCISKGIFGYSSFIISTFSF